MGWNRVCNTYIEVKLSEDYSCLIVNPKQQRFLNVLMTSFNCCKKTRPACRVSIKKTYEGGASMSPIVATKVLKMMLLQSPFVKRVSFDLSDREKEILTCLVEGMSYKMKRIQTQ